MQSFARHHGLESMHNNKFVRLFFSTPLHELFRLSRISIREGQSLIEALHPRYGQLYFTENLWRDDQKYGAEVLLSPGFDFDGMFDELWDQLGNGINVTAISSTYPPALRVTRLPKVDTPVFGSAPYF